MRGFLGARTLATKAIALPMSVASGLTLGSEHSKTLEGYVVDNSIREGRALRAHCMLFGQHCQPLVHKIRDQRRCVCAKLYPYEGNR